MYTHRTYQDHSNNFEQMASLISDLNGLHRCDWSLGRLYAWKYGRWSRESQMDSLFEKPYRIVVPEKDLQQTEILVPELSILLLNESGEPVSTCMGYWDRENRLMEPSWSACCSDGRKNWYLIDTIHGAKSSAILYSIAETAKVNHLKPYEYFKYLLEEIPKHGALENDSFIEDLLPWSEKLPDYIRKNDPPKPQPSKK